MIVRATSVEDGVQVELENAYRFEECGLIMVHTRDDLEVVPEAVRVQQVVEFRVGHEAEGIRIADDQADRQSSPQHEVQRVRRIPGAEQDVAADQMALAAAGCHGTQGLGSGVLEEVGAREDLFMGHDIGHATTLR